MPETSKAAFAPVGWSIFTSSTSLYSGQTLDVEALLINEDELPPGPNAGKRSFPKSMRTRKAPTELPSDEECSTPDDERPHRVAAKRCRPAAMDVRRTFAGLTLIDTWSSAELG